MPYPVNMNQHGPARSLEDYLGELYAKLGGTPMPSPAARDLARRIRAIENELAARSAP